MGPKPRRTQKITAKVHRCLEACSRQLALQSGPQTKKNTENQSKSAQVSRGLFSTIGSPKWAPNQEEHRKSKPLKNGVAPFCRREREPRSRWCCLRWSWVGGVCVALPIYIWGPFWSRKSKVHKSSLVRLGFLVQKGSLVHHFGA